MNKKLIILSAFAIAFISIGAGCAKQDTNNQIVANDNTVSSTITYNNAEYGFSFKYPNDWFITKGFSETSQPESIFISKVKLKEGGEDLGNLSIVINKSSLEKNIRKNLISREEVTFAGRSATKIKFTGDWGPAKISILIPDGDYTFVITYGPEDKDYSSIEKILTSFSFETTVKVGPLSYSTIGVPVTVSITTTSFDYTAEELKSVSELAGIKNESGYFDKLISKFNGTTETIYTFQYTGVKQDSGKFVVTLIPNKAGYTSLDQFKKDFDIYDAGGDAYPNMLNNNWLLFVSSCGSGYDDGSGQPHGCDEIKKVVSPTLKLN
ncbi:MAG: PsbP-related protein [Candidatus Magasanikiibacteriota bacterium]